MYQKLKNLDVEKTDLDEQVFLLATAEQVKGKYEVLLLPVPDWLENASKLLKLEIDLRRKDMLAKRKRELENGLAALRTAEEKRADMRAELERLTAQLG